MADLPDFQFNIAPGRTKTSRVLAKTAETAKRSARADRGKKAEEAVAKALRRWSQAAPGREANRLLDARAAGRVVKSAPADFEFFQGPTRQSRGTYHGLLEVKSTKHSYRLSVDKVPQLARLVHRTHCGGVCGVLIYHSEESVWRTCSALYLYEQRGGASWDLRHLPTYPSADAALRDLAPEVFASGSESEA